MCIWIQTKLCEKCDLLIYVAIIVSEQEVLKDITESKKGSNIDFIIATAMFLFMYIQITDNVCNL